MSEVCGGMSEVCEGMSEVCETSLDEISAGVSAFCMVADECGSWIVVDELTSCTMVCESLDSDVISGVLPAPPSFS